MTNRALKQLPWFLAVSLALMDATVMQGVLSPVTFYTSKSAFDAVTGSTLLEDFESITPQNTQQASFTSNGVTYTGLAGSPSANVYVISAGATNFGAGVPQPTTSSILTASGDEDFTADFSMTVYAIGFDTYLNGLGAATVSIFNASTLLGSFNYAGSDNTKEYLGVVSSIPITSMQWTTTLGGTLNTGIDNISISAIPEPSQTALAMAGLLLGVALYFRARRSV